MNQSTLTRWAATLLGLAGAGTIAYNNGDPTTVRLGAVIAGGVVAAAHTLAAHYHLGAQHKATARVAAAKANAQTAALADQAQAVSGLAASLQSTLAPLAGGLAGSTVSPPAAGSGSVQTAPASAMFPTT